MRRFLHTLLIAQLAFPATLLAQSGDKATAEILFNEGRAAAQQGKYELACEKLAESQRMDPAAGTLLNLGDCQERLGRTASAWATWLEAAASARSAGQGEREAHARQRAEALVPRLVTLTVEVPPEHRVEGLTVMRNDVVLGPPSWGTATPVDPGQYKLSAKAPGYQPWEASIAVREGTPARLLVPRLTPEAVTETPAAAQAPPVAPAAVAPSGPVHSKSATGPSPIVYVAAGVGVVGLGVGTFFGLSAMNKNDDSKDECRTATRCSAEGVELRGEAFDAATISTVGFVAGGVGLATAAVLWFAIPNSERSEAGAGIRAFSASADETGGKVSLRGVF